MTQVCKTKSKNLKFSEKNPDFFFNFFSRSWNGGDFHEIGPQTESRNSRDHDLWNHEMQGPPVLWHFIWWHVIWWHVILEKWRFAVELVSCPTCTKNGIYPLLTNFTSVSRESSQTHTFSSVFVTDLVRGPVIEAIASCGKSRTKN